MIAALRPVSLRHCGRHKLRTLLTVGGLALGVATVVGMRLLHRSAARSYERTVERIAGKAVLQIVNGEVGVPEELLEEVLRVRGVTAAVASVQGFLSVPSRPGERLYVFGIDLVADQALREYAYGPLEGSVEDPLLFLAQPTSIAVSTEFLERNGLALEDRLAVLAPSGVRDLTIRASLEAGTGPASLFGGRVAVMDVFAAQRLFGLDRRFTQIDIGRAEGADLAALREELARVVGGRGIVETPRARGETLERLLAGNRYGMTLGAMLAIVVGLYLILNTMMVAVAQRTREIGLLRALGMRRGEVLRLVVAEALVLGAVGCAVGVPLGDAMARGMAGAFATSVSSLYVAVEVPEVRLDLASVLWGVVAGLASALVAAILPARDAVRVRPLEALRVSLPRATRAEPYRRAAAAGLLLAAGAVVIWVARPALPVPRNASGQVAIIGLLVGVSLIVPLAIRAFALRAEQLLGRLLGLAGVLASRAIGAHLGRVAITCSALLVSLVGAIVVAAWLSSFQRTLGTWMDGLFGNLDLVISSGARPLAGDSTPLPGEIAEALAALPGVARVDAVRTVKVGHAGSLTSLVATDASLYAEGVRTLALIDGSAASTYPALVRGEAVAVNEAFTLRFGKQRGDTIHLPTPSGEVRLPIAAVYFDPSYADLGVVLMDRGLYRRLWRDDTVNFIEPALEPGADRQAVIGMIRERWGERHQLFVATVEQFRAEAEALLEQTMLLSYPVVVISIGIALLGLVNSLLASILDRVREIGLLRSIGAARSQVVRAIVIEATLVGLLGSVLAAAVGSVLAYVQVDVLVRGTFGMTILYRYPTRAVVFALLAAPVLAAAAGWLPGRSASRLNVTDALAYE
jgi:putative ABC transport system permease protein